MISLLLFIIISTQTGLPDSPLNAEDWISSVTVDSFTVTWSHRSSGGKAQKFTVTYCEVVRPEECSEISGIGQTRTRIENLRPFTLYRVTVKSHTVYGFSENNEFIEKSTIRKQYYYSLPFKWVITSL